MPNYQRISKSYLLPVACCLLPVVACCLLPVALCHADDPQVTKLRQQGDWRGLEQHCRKELSKPDLALDHRAELTAELAGSLAQQANAHRIPAQAEKLWNDADATLAKFVKENPTHPRTLLMLRQRSIYAYSRGDALRQESELLGRADTMDKARAHLSRALEHAQAVETAVRKLLDLAKDPKAPKPIPFEQLLALNSDVLLRLGQIHISLAQAHPETDEERAKALQQADQALALLTSVGYSENETYVRGFLALAECRRLQKDHDKAAAALQPILDSKQTGERFKDEALALKMQVLLDQNRAQEALALVALRRKRPAPMALAAVHALFIESKRVAGQEDKQQATRLQTEALRQIDLGEREHGSAWLRRAERLLAQFGDPDLLADDLAAVARIADSLARTGKLERAAGAYQRAAGLAKKADDKDRAYDLALRGAAALTQAGKHIDAADAFLALSREAAQPAKAAQAHLLAAHALRRAWEKHPTAAARQRLKTVLAEHLKQYDQGPTTIEAHYLSGRVALAEERWSEALQHYRQVPPEHPLFVHAVREATAGFDGLLTAATGEEAERYRAEALRFFADKLRLLPATAENREVSVALRLGRARLLARPGATRADLQQANADIQELLKQPELDLAAHAAARHVLLQVYPGMGRTADAVRLLEQEIAARPEELWSAHHTLARWAESPAPAARHEIALLQWIAAHTLQEKDPKLTAEQRRELQRAEAWALVYASQPEPARKLWGELRQAAPRDGRLAEEHARALMQLGSAEDFAAAVPIWQALSAGRKEGGAAWLEAKYQLAAALRGAGERERARKVVRVISDLWLADQTFPWYDPRRIYREKFTDLERQLGR